MGHTYHLTPTSRNVKTGPIPVTTTSSDTCPASCPLKGNGCYAESGPMALHWGQVSKGLRGGTLAELCSQLRRLPKRQLWRWAQAGDLPGDTVLLDAAGVEQLVVANDGRSGFGYTHYDCSIPHNAAIIKAANQEGFTINLSADSLADADALADLQVGPVVTVLPANATKPLRTPAGRLVAVCPAAVRDDVTCASCGICAVAHRKAIIGFPAHGSGAKKAQAVFMMRTV
jgi:hypothetical protein